MNITAQIIIALAIGNIGGEFLVAWLKTKPFDIDDVCRTIFYQSTAIVLHAYALSRH